MFGHGWRPLAYGTIRYFVAIALFWVFTYQRERSFRIARQDMPRVLFAALMIFVNQICFVYALKLADASTVAMIFGATPVFVAAISVVLGLERLQLAFWIGAGLTFVGVALIALGAGSGVPTSLEGNLIAVGMAVTWACYTLAIAPLMNRYSPFRISSVVLLIGWLPLAMLSVPQLADQEYSFGWLVWLGLVYAVIGPLFLTTILWFEAVAIVGASRASLFNNIQPFFAVLFALLLLGESLYPLEIVGGMFIFAGIAVERVWHRAPVAAPPGD
jgi:drug/metabolite transporter (DMT)-like permease